MSFARRTVPVLPKRAALYLRVSTSRQAQGEVSLPSQRDLTTRYCEAQGWAVVAEFVEPGAWIFDMLRARDWHNADVIRDRDRAREQAERAAEKRREDDARRMNEEVLDAYLAGTRTFVSMNRDTPWTQSAAGRRG